MSCKGCVSETVCKYNDGVNEWCKGNCPQFKSKYLTFLLPPCENCGFVIYDLTVTPYRYIHRGITTITSEITPRRCPQCHMIIDRIEVDIENQACIVRGADNG